MFLVWWNTFDNIFISYYEGITKIGKKFNFDDGFLSGIASIMAGSYHCWVGAFVVAVAGRYAVV